MADYATKDDLKELETSLDVRFEAVEKKIDKAVDDLSAIIKDFASAVDDRFNSVEARLDKLEASHVRLVNTLDSFLKRLDDIETDNAARDAKYDRLERWVQQIAEKTGVKLEY